MMSHEFRQQGPTRSGLGPIERGRNHTSSSGQQGGPCPPVDSVTPFGAGSAPAAAPHRHSGSSNGLIAASARHVISQELLARYKDVDDAKKELEREREQLRSLILQLHEGGATVESGPLTARISQQMQRRLTATSLTPILGATQVKRLQQQVTPTTVTYLTIEPSGF